MIRFTYIRELKVDLWPSKYLLLGFAWTWWLRGRMRSQGSTVRHGPYYMDHIIWTLKWSLSSSNLVSFIQVSWSLCEAFYIPPDQESNSIYPYSNTFNVTGPIDWSESGGSNSLDRYRAIGTHNSYHVQQYEEPGIHIPSELQTSNNIRTVSQSRV